MINTLGIIAGATLALFNQTGVTKPISTPTDPEEPLPYTVVQPQPSAAYKQTVFASIYAEQIYTVELSATTSSMPDLPKDTPVRKPQPSPAQLKPAVTTDTPTIAPPQVTIEAAAETDSTSGLNPETLLSLINAYREQKSLPRLETHPDLCQLAQSRSPELHGEIFNGQGLHSGLRKRNLPYYVTENMIHQPNETAALNWWLNSTIHRQAIESTKHTYACGACQGNSCAILFSSFVAKQ